MGDRIAGVFNCESLARGKVLLDCGATDTVGSVETVEAIIDKAQELFGEDPDWVTVDTNDRLLCKSIVSRRGNKALSKVRVEVHQLPTKVARL